MIMMDKEVQIKEPVRQHEESAHGGQGWYPRTTSSIEDIGTIWGNFGSTSECGVLRSVLMHRPGPEIENVDDPTIALWLEKIDPIKAREQHDNLTDVYRSNGIEVNYVGECPIDKPNMYFCRDLFAMTPYGAIIARPASRIRAGEERYIAKALTNIGVPILLTVYGDAVFEGADIVIINPDLVFIGEGIRTNRRGVEQVSHLFRDIGFARVEVVQLNYGCGHLDGVLSVLDKDLAVLYPTQISYRVWQVLKEHGFDILDLPDMNEARLGMSINVVPIAPRLVVIPCGNPNTRRALEKLNVTCIEVDVSELMKGGGAIHCMTGTLKREPI